MVRFPFYLVNLLFFLLLLSSGGRGLSAAELPTGAIRPEIMQTVFSGSEEMHFTISWTGGIKIGDLYLRLERREGGYVIDARVTDYGLFRFFYPVDDVFTTLVRGPLKLPYRYDVLQREGRGRVIRRLTRYDQENLTVVYTKNDLPAEVFNITGTVHNEFSSFYITRLMTLELGEPFIVPTFADKKRNEVSVVVKGKEDIDSSLGRLRTVLVEPRMRFRGLYDKDGDTVIWLSDDTCRIPVRIRSKILIGSLTADLKSYVNPGCEHY